MVKPLRMGLVLERNYRLVLVLLVFLLLLVKMMNFNARDAWQNQCVIFFMEKKVKNMECLSKPSQTVPKSKYFASYFETEFASIFCVFSNENMKAYLGETKMKMLQEFGAIKEKYGSQPASCHNVFHSTCPWDSAGMSSIFMKLMVRA